MRLFKILGSLVGVAVAFLAVSAKAQYRYDNDQAWIRKTIRQDHHWERHGLKIEHRHRDRWRNSPVRKRYYGRSHEHRVVRRQETPTRVYSYVQNCFAPVKEQSGDFATDAKALNEAEVRWGSKVAVEYGLIFADFSNAIERKSTCFRSTFDESFWGRNKEALAQNLNISEGYKKRCIVEARPCRAPTERLESSNAEVRMGVKP